ncbi:MAG: hypothetical protein EBQ69_05430 [Betaproteobacteria bacterium]|nr:hypothetical protein [Betaproteobacteria bacterium]
MNPQLTPASQLDAQLLHEGHVVLAADTVCELAACQLQDLMALTSGWNDLPPDAHLKDGGRYRRRRHSCFEVQHNQWHQVAHRAHWQPLEYNALHGGMERMFDPIHDAVVHQPAWGQLMLWLARVSSQLKVSKGDSQQGGQGASVPHAHHWFVEAHQFRIDTTGGIGRPTPEGAHRDGVELVAVFMVQRHLVKGGETRVFKVDSPAGERFTLAQPWSVLLLDDERVIHETTPIQPQLPNVGGYRDTLVVTLRSGGFQGA